MPLFCVQFCGVHPPNSRVPCIPPWSKFRIHSWSHYRLGYQMSYTNAWYPIGITRSDWLAPIVVPSAARFGPVCTGDKYGWRRDHYFAISCLTHINVRSHANTLIVTLLLQITWWLITWKARDLFRASLTIRVPQAYNPRVEHQETRASVFLYFW